MVHASLTQGPCQPGAKGKTGRDGERLFADAIKTMVSGEAVFALSMSFQTSLIRGNLLRRLSATLPVIGKKYFLFLKCKVRATTPKIASKQRQHHPK
ncbi:hypothetical protein [Janthinobacterium sp. FW305-128]|uniref:hypothetical protein n=1 Tax=Janthinobacterium sp. FW305-128 TaxID=2775055 RepID=UPI001E5F2033|nr:hypothetical protein [Janthinobacterium sp. FW305-128]MCC7684578.1 hypothetical protein [Janthinobacterium sp. FW305-128]